MDNEKEESKPKEAQVGTKKRGRVKSLIIAFTVPLIIGGGGFMGYTRFFSPKHGSEEKKETEKKAVLFAIEPLVLNLAGGRFLKLSVQFELTDSSYEHMVSDKTPQLRDAIITFISSKSVESISTPEGKLQLKDEILLRANRVMGNGVFSNLYFTEFVMQ